MPIPCPGHRFTGLAQNVGCGKAGMTDFEPGRNMENWQRDARRGAAAVELAVLLPVIVFLFVIAVDFGRVFYFSQVIENCARNGAIYGSNLTTAQSPYSSIQEAALAEAQTLSPPPTVT